MAILGGLQKEWHHTALPILQEHYEGPVHCQTVQLILLSKAKTSKHEREFSVVRRRGRGVVRSIGSVWSRSPVELSRLLRSRSFPKIFPTKFHEIVKILIVLLHALWHTCQAHVYQIRYLGPMCAQFGTEWATHAKADHIPSQGREFGRMLSNPNHPSSRPMRWEAAG